MDPTTMIIASRRVAGRDSPCRYPTPIRDHIPTSKAVGEWDADVLIQANTRVRMIPPSAIVSAALVWHSSGQDSTRSCPIHATRKAAKTGVEPTAGLAALLQCR
jgi:hypothetical protein